MNTQTRRGLVSALAGFVLLLCGAFVAGNAGSIGASKLGSLTAWIGLVAVLVGLAIATWGALRHTKSSSGVRSN